MASNNSNTDKQDIDISAANDVWRQTLQSIATTFGKLVYLSGLRDEGTGRYNHYGLSQRYSEEQANLVLTLSHEEVFFDWLELSLEQQNGDLNLYLTDSGSDPALVVDNWLRLEPYRRLIPASAPREERELYISDIEMLLDLIRKDLSSSSAAS